MALDRPGFGAIAESMVAAGVIGMSVTDVNALLEDSDGDLWAGVWGGGLVRIAESADGGVTFQAYRHDASDPTSLAIDDLNALAQLPKLGGACLALDSLEGMRAHGFTLPRELIVGDAVSGRQAALLAAPGPTGGSDLPGRFEHRYAGLPTVDRDQHLLSQGDPSLEDGGPSLGCGRFARLRVDGVQQAEGQER